MTIFAKITLTLAGIIVVLAVIGVFIINFKIPRMGNAS